MSAPQIPFDAVALSAEADQLRKQLAAVLSSGNAVGATFDWVLRQLESALAGAPLAPGKESGTPIRGRELICFQVSDGGMLKPFRLCGTAPDGGLGIAVPRVPFPRGEGANTEMLRFEGTKQPVVAAFDAYFGPTQSAWMAPVIAGGTLWGALAMACPVLDPLGDLPVNALRIAADALSERLAGFTLLPRGGAPSGSVMPQQELPLESFLSHVEASRKRNAASTANLHILAYALPRVSLAQRKEAARLAPQIMPQILQICRDSDFTCAYSNDVILIFLDGCAPQSLPKVMKRLREWIGACDSAAAGDGLAATSCAYQWVSTRDLVNRIVGEARAGVRPK